MPESRACRWAPFGHAQTPGPNGGGGSLKERWVRLRMREQGQSLLEPRLGLVCVPPESPGWAHASSLPSIPRPRFPLSPEAGRDQATF